MELNACQVAPIEWKRHSIGSVCAKLTSGGTPSRSKSEYYQNGTIPWVKTKELLDCNIYRTEECITEEAVSNSSAKVLPQGTVLMAMYGATVGQLGIIARPMSCNQACAAMTVDAKKADRDFLYYQLLLHREQIKSLATGAAQQNLSGVQIRQFVLPFPEIDEQVRIASTLRVLDDSIELNRRLNNTLESMARALFKEWFVDFGPTRAKMEGRQPSGLTSDILDMFPDALNEVGVPQGWDIGTLGDLATLNPESWSKKNAPAEIEYVDLANTKWGAIELTTRFAWADAPSRAQRILRPGDTIVGTVRPGNGSYSYVSVDGLTGSTGFAILRPKDEKNRELLFLAATSSENIERLAHLADGGAYPAVRPEVVLATPVVLPGSKLMAAFSDVVAPLIKTIEQNKHEVATLGALRDILLPKLLSGEVRIRDAEVMAGDVV